MCERPAFGRLFQIIPAAEDKLGMEHAFNKSNANQ